MRSSRYEILVPLKYNDGREIEPDKILQTKEELVQRFGGFTVDPAPQEGIWRSGGEAYEDILIRLMVDVEEDSPEVEAFFAARKETLKARFQQSEIWIVAYPIRII
jgi:hypothetical protein